MKNAPMYATTEKKLCELSHDNVCVGPFALSIDGLNVYLTEHYWGESTSRQEITIPHPVFRKLVRWWVTGIVPKEDARSRKPPREKAKP